MDLNDKIERESLIQEAVYSANLAFEEMINFYQMASDDEIKKMETLIKKRSWKGVKKMIKKVLGIALK